MNYLSQLLWAQRGCTLLAGFAIPLSTAATNISLPLAILFWAIRTTLTSGWKTTLAQWRKHPLIQSSLFLFFALVIGMFYSVADWREAFSTLSKYKELFYLPCFLMLFQDEFSKRWGLVAFLAAMAITLCLSYSVAWGGFSLDKATADNPAVFKNYITQGILLAIAAYLLAVEWLTASLWGRIWRTLLVSLALFNASVMNQGRTGYVIILCLILLFVFQCWRWRGVAIGIVGVTVLSMTVYFSSPVVRHRIDTIGTNMEAYQQGNKETSVGFRLEFYKNSLHLIRQHPWFGTGTGSFSVEYDKLAAQLHVHPSANPHNEFLMLGVQLGFLGILLFSYFLWQAWRLSFELTDTSRRMAQGIVVTMLVGCLFNSLLLDFTEGHIFVYLLGWIYAFKSV